MKLFAKLLVFLLVFSSVVQAQNKADLRFNKKGEFKIVQFTDTHVNLSKNTNLNVYDIVADIMKAEKPDLVVLTGDIVTGENPKRGYERFENVFAKAGIPWVVTFGNHDSESNFPRQEVAELLQQFRWCLNNDTGETEGNSNFTLTVAGKKKENNALLYFMDSQEYSTLKPLVDGWGWFKHEQVDWYRKKSKEFTCLNNGTPMNALAFFHIPLPEYIQAWNNKINPPVGVRNEDECSPEINTGMFAAMLESGDVMGTFVGHDHINDYIGVHYGIALAYGRVTKVMKNPEEDPLAGGRVIVLTEEERKFDTWIRDMNGKKELECSWPASFSKTK
ncbi:metallophosphoesterase family protein [Prolixibacteraceae bacterium Z1-6]|uniref:Metallophosphoesterase family protein n=1 Tax=Draconibacterium aestuarii TaxID=2998507 RepID=A0A9X3J706_9BACT|nr:metallophosphoesterase family protein [Prolixibacteraceae bacterium Z1-6]